MKKLAVIVSMLLFGSLTLAQAATPVPTPNPALKNVNGRMMQDIQFIKKDQHSGKITLAQAKADRDQVKTIRKQELDDMKVNGTKTLTAAQEASINQALNTF